MGVKELILGLTNKDKISIVTKHQGVVKGFLVEYNNSSFNLPNVKLDYEELCIATKITIY